MKISLQEGSILVSPSSEVSAAIRTYLPPWRTTKGNSNRLHVWEVSETALRQQLKRGLLMSGDGDFVRWPLTLGGRVVILDGKMY